MPLDRQNYIGGSDAAALMSDNKYKTVRDVWDRLRGADMPEVDNHHIDRGNELEPIIEQWIAENRDPTINGDDLFDRYDHDDGSGQILLRHPDEPRLAGHPDGISEGPPFESGDLLWEIKAPSSHSVENIRRHGLPSRYKWQVQFYLHLANQTRTIGRAVVCVWDCDQWGNPMEFSIPYDAGKGNELEQRGKDLLFAAEVGHAPTAEVFGREEVKMTDDPKLDELMREYRNVKDVGKKLKNARKRLKGKILTRADGAETLQTENNLARIQYDWGRYDATRLSITER